jgi:plastocyanin
MRKNRRWRAAVGVNLQRRCAWRSVMLCAVLQLPLATAPAAELTLTVQDANNQAVEGVVLVADPDTIAEKKRTARLAVMDQINMQFVPDVLVIQSGSSVDFPNSDQIQHQVYSFSAPKNFQLSLYAGHKYPPVEFDHPGLVTVGCNIHDGMLAHIYVTDSPYFGKSDAQGVLVLHDLPAGNYTLTAWHPQLQEGGSNGVQLHVTLAETTHREVSFHLSRPMRMSMQHHESKKWLDY